MVPHESGVASPSEHEKRRSSGLGHPRHRSEGKAKLSPPQTFTEEVWWTPWRFLVVGGSGLLAVPWGGSTLFTSDSIWHLALGACTVAAGVLVWASYFLHFLPNLLAAEHWTATRPRRAMRAVLAHAWWVFLGAVYIAGVANALVN
jgi:hypothetical protein